MRRLFVMLLVIAGLGGVSGVVYYRSQSGGGGRSEPFRIAVATWVGYAPLYLAAEKGFFGETNVQLIRVDDTAIYNSGLRRGDFEAVCNTVDSFVLSAAQGVPGVFAAAFDESRGADGLVGKESIRDISDLRGKRVAAQTGWPGQFFLLYLLQSVGMSLSDVDFVNLSSDMAGSAFVSGGLDAAVTWEPWLSQIANMEDGHIITTTRDHPGVIVDGLVVRSDALSSRPRDVRNVVTGYFRALEYWRSNPEDALQVMAAVFEVPEDEFEGMTDGVHFLTSQESLVYLLPTGAVANTVAIAASVWSEIEMAPPVGSVETLFTAEVLSDIVQ